MRTPALVLASSLMSSALWSQVPMGPTFVVNEDTGYVSMSRVATGANGDLVVVWCDTGNRRLSARVFRAGMPSGPEFQVNTAPMYDLCLGKQDVAAGSRGFVVVWHDVDIGRGQLFDWSGGRVGAEFQVGSSSPVYGMSAAWMPQGEFLVAWGQNSLWSQIRAQRFDAQANRVGSEFQVDGGLSDDHFPTLAAAADGRMVASWVRFDGHVFARRLDASGAPVGGEFQVSVNTTTSIRPSVALNDRGFMIVWWSSTDSRKNIGRAFDPDGNPLSPEFGIEPNEGASPDVAPYGHDRYVVSWPGAANGRTPMLARLYEADGQPHGPEFVVTRTRDYYLGFPWPQVAADALGNLSFAWNRTVDFTWRSDVMARRFYGGLIPQPAAVDPVAGTSSDGNGVLEACETVAFRPRWLNDTAATQTLDAMLSSFTGPAGATYTIVDGAAQYGTLADGASAACTSDCYAVSVSCADPRPSQHWDASAVETLAPIPQRIEWRLHVGESFSDVPRSSPYYRFVETLLHEAITAGCGPALYCPGDAVSREQMSVFVLLAREEPDFVPLPCYTSSFSDVDPANPTCPYIHALVRRGVATGCGSGRFCPGDAVTREQMSVFVLRTLDPALDPPACTAPVFADVPPSSPFCRWIEELARRGVVAGCGGGNYCPGSPVTREQMSVFLAASFALSLYGP